MIVKIGIYGGTFDPLHIGHLILGRDAMEQLGLERLIYVPNACSPHKGGRQPAPAKLRLQMLLEATAGEPGFVVDELELYRPPPSYAIDTVRELHKRYPQAEFYYLIGEDNLRELHTWREIEQLSQMVRFAVFSRSGSTEAKEQVAKLGAHPLFGRKVEVSSTEIRSRVAKGLSIRYLVPESVLRIIEEHQLYKESSHYSPTVS